MLLAELGPFLSRRGQANSGELLFWFAFFVSARFMLSEPLPACFLVCMAALDGVDEHLPVCTHLL